MLVVYTYKSIIFFVKTSIINFSPKKRALYKKKFLTKTSASFLKKKSKYKPELTNLKNLNLIKENFNITYSH